MNQIKQIITQTGIALVLTVLLTFVISAPAFAGDNKVYPGSACLPADPDFVDKLAHTDGKAKNVGSSQIAVTCPIVRDETGGGIPDSFIDVEGLTNPEACTLNTYRVDGTLIASHKDNNRRLTDVGNGVKRFDIRNAGQSNQGAYEIRCELQRDDAVVRYSMAE